MVDELSDPRRADTVSFFSGVDEQASYDAWLDWHRITLLLKCEGLDDAGRRATPIPTSRLSLHGLVRHMAEVERGWFRRTIGGEDIGYIHDYSSDEDADFDLTSAVWEDDVATWQTEIDAARAVAAARTPDDEGTHRRTGKAVSLRWVYVHMIEEYARHNGHADLIRELVDGTVGD